MTTPAFTVKESLGFGWRTFKARPWFFVGTFVLYMIAQFVLGMLVSALPAVVDFIVSFLVSALLNVGLITIYLAAYENPQTPSYKDFWNPKPFWRYLGASILLGIIVLVGFVLLIIPGVFAAIVLSMTGYLVVEKGLNPIAALKESYRITKGSRWKIFLLGLAAAVLSIIGMIPLFLGLLIVAPVTMLAFVHAYRALSGDAPVVEVAAAPAPAPAPEAA